MLPHVDCRIEGNLRATFLGFIRGVTRRAWVLWLHGEPAGVESRAEHEVSAGLVCLAAASLAGILGFMLLESLGAKILPCPFAVIVCEGLLQPCSANCSVASRACCPDLASTSSTKFRLKTAWQRTWPGSKQTTEWSFAE